MNCQRNSIASKRWFNGEQSDTWQERVPYGRGIVSRSVSADELIVDVEGDLCWKRERLKEDNVSDDRVSGLWSLVFYRTRHDWRAQVRSKTVLDDPRRQVRGRASWDRESMHLG